MTDFVVEQKVKERINKYVTEIERLRENEGYEDAPMLGAFGLNIDDYRRCAKLTVRLDDRIVPALEKCIYAVSVICIAANGLTFSADIFDTIVVVSISLLIAMIPTFCLAWVVRRCVEGFSPLPLEEAKRYESAVTVYHVQCQFGRRGPLRLRTEYWASLSATRFEQEVAVLFEGLGFAAIATPASHDGGVDIFLKIDGAEILVQCKLHNVPVGPGPVRELYGVLMGRGSKSGIVVSPSGFTDGARAFANGKPIQLLEARDIVAMEKRSQRLRWQNSK